MRPVSVHLGLPVTQPSGDGRKRLHSILTAMLAATAAVLFVHIPWQQFSGQGFPDRDNYISAINAYVSLGERPFDLTDFDWVALLLDEYLWKQCLIAIGVYFQDPEIGLQTIACLAIFLVTLHVGRKAGLASTVVLLASPLTIDLFMSQTRSALAVALFMHGVSIRGAALRYALLAVTFLVHSFGLVLVVIYVLNAMLLRREAMSARSKLAVVVLFALAASAVWSFGAQDIFAAVGDRRADQPAILPASVAFATWWICLLVVLASSARPQGDSEVDQFTLTAVALLGMFVFTTLFGGGGLRFLSLSLPFVFIAIRTVKRAALRACVVLGTVAFNALHSYLWLA